MNKKTWIILLGVLVAFLNIFDGIATIFGLMNDYIEELNPLMRSLFITSPAFFICFKMGLSLLIFYVSLLIYKHSKNTFQMFYLFALGGVSCLYVGIFGLHLIWIKSLIFN